MLYLLKDIGDGISLTGADITAKGKLKACDPRWLEVVREPVQRSLVVAVKTIAGGEKPQRKRAFELKQKRSRNLSTHVQRTVEYLASQLPHIIRKGVRDLDIEGAQKLLSEVLPPVKAKLGWPVCNPVEWSYRITPDAIDSVESETGRALLAAEMPLGIILPQRLKLIEARFRHDVPDEAEALIEAIRKTANRNHLALISLTGDRDKDPRVVIVDQGKNRLEMPAWKLVDLLEHPDTARKLYRFPADYLKERYPEVVFNGESRGDLVAKYLPKDSVMRVVAIAEQSADRRMESKSSTATFYLDQDYLVCLWIVLKRITDDRQKHRDWLEQVEARVDIDPFSLMGHGGL